MALKVHVGFHVPNGLTDLEKTIIVHFSSQGYHLLRQSPNEWVFKRGQKWATLFRNDIRAYYTEAKVGIGNETEQGTWVSVDFEAYTFMAITTGGDAAVLEAEGRQLESKIRSGI